MEKFLSFMDILKVYLDESQVADFVKNSKTKDISVPFTPNIEIIESQFAVNRRIQIENLVTLTVNELPKAKYADLFLYLSKQSINIGLFSLAEDILNILIKKLENVAKMHDFLASAYFNLGEIYFRQGSWKNAGNYISKAKKIFQAEKNRAGVFKCDNLIGAILGEKGEMSKALKSFNKTLLSLNPDKEKYLYAMVESNLGILYHSVNNYNDSYSYLKRALLFFEQVKDLTRVSELKYNVANLYFFKKEYKETIVKLDAAIDAAVKAENLPILCLCFVTKADSYVNLGDLKMANAVINLAMEISSKINDRLSIAEVYKIKGKIELQLKNLKYAENLLLTSYRLNNELENKFNLAETCDNLSILYTLKKNPKESARFKKLAKNYWQSIISN